MRIVSIIAATMLMGCAANVSTTDLGDQTHIIKMEEGKVISSRVGILNNYESTTEELCPTGHKIISQRTENEGRYRTFFWKIKCIKKGDF